MSNFEHKIPSQGQHIIHRLGVIGMCNGNFPKHRSMCLTIIANNVNVIWPHALSSYLAQTEEIVKALRIFLVACVCPWVCVCVCVCEGGQVNHEIFFLDLIKITKSISTYSRSIRKVNQHAV